MTDTSIPHCSKNKSLLQQVNVLGRTKYPKVTQTSKRKGVRVNATVALLFSNYVE
jgi:hypothetical protein